MKRMFDKEEIVDLIQEESPKVEVDSELSETSENPVQNKVIYEALQNVGSGKYLHEIHCVNTSYNIYLRIYIVNTTSSSMTESFSLASYLKDNGFIDSTKGIYFPVYSARKDTTHPNYITTTRGRTLYSSNGTSVMQIEHRVELQYTTDGTSVTCDVNSYDSSTFSAGTFVNKKDIVYAL